MRIETGGGKTGVKKQKLRNRSRKLLDERNSNKETRLRKQEKRNQRRENGGDKLEERNRRKETGVEKQEYRNMSEKQGQGNRSKNRSRELGVRYNSRKICRKTEEVEQEQRNRRNKQKQKTVAEEQDYRNIS